MQIIATSIQHVCTWSWVCAHTKQLTLGTSSCLFKPFGSTFEHNTVQKIEIATTPSCVFKQPESVFRWFFWQKNYWKNGLHGLLLSLQRAPALWSARSGNQWAGNLAQLVKVQICVEMVHTLLNFKPAERFKYTIINKTIHLWIYRYQYKLWKNLLMNLPIYTKAVFKGVPTFIIAVAVATVQLVDTDTYISPLRSVSQRLVAHTTSEALDMIIQTKGFNYHGSSKTCKKEIYLDPSIISTK